MAEAEKPSGPPRKTNTLKEFSGMNSQDGRYGVEPEEFFFLENIMRVSDGKLHSVSGPTSKGVFPPADILVLGTPFGDYIVTNPDLDYMRNP